MAMLGISIAIFRDRLGARTSPGARSIASMTEAELYAAQLELQWQVSSAIGAHRRRA